MGRRYIQHPETHKLIPAEEYVRPGKRGPYIQSDIAPYQCPVTGEMITSRSTRRAVMKEHNLVEVGNEKPNWMREREYERKHKE